MRSDSAQSIWSDGSTSTTVPLSAGTVPQALGSRCGGASGADSLLLDVSGGEVDGPVDGAVLVLLGVESACEGDSFDSAQPLSSSTVSSAPAPIGVRPQPCRRRDFRECALGI